MYKNKDTERERDKVTSVVGLTMVHDRNCQMEEQQDKRIVKLWRESMSFSSDSLITCFWCLKNLMNSLCLWFWLWQRERQSGLRSWEILWGPAAVLTRMRQGKGWDESRLGEWNVRKTGEVEEETWYLHSRLCRLHHWPIEWRSLWRLEREKGAERSLEVTCA